jgi:hypothetical protein
LIPQTSTSTTTTTLALVGSGGSPLVESRKNGQIFRGIIWWDYLVGSTEFSRPPAHPPAAAPTEFSHPAPHRGAAELHSPPARSVSLPQVNGQKPDQLTGFYPFRSLLKLQMIPPRKLPTSKPTSKAHISPLPTNGTEDRPSCTEDHQTIAPFYR